MLKPLRFALQLPFKCVQKLIGHFECFSFLCYRCLSTVCSGKVRTHPGELRWTTLREHSPPTLRVASERGSNNVQISKEQVGFVFKPLMGLHVFSKRRGLESFSEFFFSKKMNRISVSLFQPGYHTENSACFYD